MKYNFYLEEKVTAWERYHFSVEADSLEAARNEAIRLVKDDNIEIDYHEDIPDLTMPMKPEDNDGFATQEIFDPEEDDTPFYRNGKE